MSVVYHDTIEQGSDAWLQLRCGILTASTIGRIMTPTGKAAVNDKSRALEWELLAQRISRHVEPQHISDAMLRGHEDEIYARALYAERHTPVDQIGFITRQFDGFTIGYSPDGLVEDDGLIECKSRAQRFQVETIITDIVPSEYMAQIQCGLLVTGRAWLDYCSYSNGLPMMVKRVLPDADMIAAIVEAATAFEARINDRLATYADKLANRGWLYPTERRETMEII